MLAVDRWEVYYGDGSVFTSDDGTWADAPAFGLICVVYYVAPDADSSTFAFRQTNAVDVSVYEWWPEAVPTPEARVDLTRRADGLKMGLWVADEQHYEVMHRATLAVTPPPEE